MTRKILITGGLGYLGVKLSNYLAEHQKSLMWNGKTDTINKIVLLDRTCQTPNKALLTHDPKIIISDLSSSEDIDLIAYGDYDSIFHFGGAASAACQENPELGEKNVKATEIVLKGASQKQEKRRLVVFPSSYLVFENMIKAHDKTEPNSTRPYGKSKWRSENLGMEYMDRVNFRGIRLPAVIAEREPTSAATAYAYNLPNRLFRGDDCIVPVPKKYRMPLVWIDDAIQGFIKIHNIDEKLLIYENKPYRVINFSGHSPLAEEWVKKIETVSQRHNVKCGNVIWKEDPATREVLESAANYIEGTFAKKLGISPKTNIIGMIEKIALKISN